MTPKELVEYFEGTSQAAFCTGVSGQTIRDWMEAKSIPPQWQSHIERVTARALKADPIKRKLKANGNAR